VVHTCGQCEAVILLGNQAILVSEDGQGLPGNQSKSPGRVIGATDGGAELPHRCPFPQAATATPHRLACVANRARAASSRGPTSTGGAAAPWVSHRRLNAENSRTGPSALADFTVTLAAVKLIPATVTV